MGRRNFSDEHFGANEDEVIESLQEDVEEMSGEDKEEEEREAAEGKTLEQIHEGLQKLMKDIERMQSKL